ncbi:MAG: hypothetical protein ACREUG_01290 [Steroidobacteraceae bacterium]
MEIMMPPDEEAVPQLPGEVPGLRRLPPPARTGTTHLKLELGPGLSLERLPRVASWQLTAKCPAVCWHHDARLGTGPRALSLDGVIPKVPLAIFLAALGERAERWPSTL